MIILVFQIFINSYHFNEINPTLYYNKNFDNTILLEIKTWKYTNDNNFNYYITTYPYSTFDYGGKDMKFFNFDLILNMN